ncbi:MAG: hypothetical protein K5686_13575 [Lachnospiraceae bacterium]|nr:hypothetical protein [Lachnospiraceae bacterium]
MKMHFISSLCRGGGLIGGILIAGDEGLTYKTNKLTIPSEYRNLEMKYSDISGISKGWLFILPVVSVDMSSGESYKFFVIGRNRLYEILNRSRRS